MANRHPSLAGARAKRARAQHHFDDLQGRVEPFFQNYHCDTEVAPDPGRSRFVVRLVNPPPIPEIEWAVIIGDCVHNLRLIFDYIVWELAGGDPADIDTQFPIYDCQRRFERVRQRRIGRLSQPAQVFIERMQPYHAAARGMDIRRHFLRALHLLDIADKHKLLTPTVGQPQAAGFEIQPNDLWERVRLLGDAIAVHGVEVAHVLLPGEFVPDVQIKLNTIFNIAFADSVGSVNASSCWRRSRRS
jgi:hypothetical protein